MSATSLPTAKPSWAVVTWLTDTHIYIEIPASAGQPYITKFSITEGGLSKALNFLRKRYEVVPMEEKNYTKGPVEPGYVCESAGAPAVYRRQPQKVQSDEDRAMAVKILRDKGII